MVPGVNKLAVRIGLLAILGVSIAAAGAVLWQHYSGLVDAKADLSAKVSGLESDVAREKARADALVLAVSKWDEAAKAQAVAMADFTKAQRSAQAYSKELKNVLSTHDLNALARAKPKLVEARINAGSSRALRMLEHASQTPSAGTVTDSAGASPASPGGD